MSRQRLQKCQTELLLMSRKKLWLSSVVLLILYHPQSVKSQVTINIPTQNFFPFQKSKFTRCPYIFSYHMLSIININRAATNLLDLYLQNWKILREEDYIDNEIFLIKKKKDLNRKNCNRTLTFHSHTNNQLNVFVDLTLK